MLCVGGKKNSYELVTGEKADLSQHISTSQIKKPHNCM